MNKKTIIAVIFALVAMTGQAQTSFDLGEGCLNVIDVSYARGIGKYGDGGISANYLHEKFINERFSIGAGIGYNHHEKYKFSAIPVFLSTHYFFLDKQFSPFVNLCVGGFALFNAKNVGTNEKYSLSKEKQGFSLFMSPSVDEAYLVKAFDVNKNDYKSRLIHSMGINVGVCFQIKGW